MTTASLTTDVARANISSIDKVQGEYGNAWASMFGAANASNKAGWENSNANVGGILGITGQLGRMAYNHNENKAMMDRMSSMYNPFSAGRGVSGGWEGQQKPFGMNNSLELNA